MQPTITLASTPYSTVMVQLTAQEDAGQTVRKKLQSFFQALQTQKLFSTCDKALEEWKDKVQTLNLNTQDPAVQEKNVFMLCHFLFHVIRPYIVATKNVEILQKQLERVELEYRTLLQGSFPQVKVDELITKIHQAKFQKHLKDKKVEQFANQNTSETQEKIKILFLQAQLSQQELANNEEILKHRLKGVYHLGISAQQTLQTQAQTLPTQVQTLSLVSIQNSETFVAQGEKIVQGEKEFQEIQEKTAQLLKKV